MRIIGGKWKGRRIHVPAKGWPVRPTTDFAREALFNILDNRVDYGSISALDLFGGTGLHSFELVSRGCPDVTYVDKYKASAAFVRSVVKEWDMPVTVICSDVKTFLRDAVRQWDYIFADPPYDMPDLESFPARVLDAGILKSGGFLVLEHPSKISFNDHAGYQESRNYGQTTFTFFAL